MTSIAAFADTLLRLQLAMVHRVTARITATGRDRGDVPGWVLVTLMTAGLVTILWAVAGERLEEILREALDSVTGP